MVKVSDKTLTPFKTIPLYKNKQNKISDITIFPSLLGFNVTANLNI